MKLSFDDIAAIGAEIAADNLDAVRARIEAGLDPVKAISDDYPLSVFQIAALNGAVMIIRYLIKSGADVNKGVRKWTPLMEACEVGKAEVVRILLEAGADPNLKSGTDDEGDREMTALTMAAEGRHLEIIRMLLDAGADPAAITRKGLSAINFVTSGDREGRLELVKMLVDLGCPVVGACLIRPIYDADVEMVRYLLDHGADPNQPSTRQEQVANGPGVLPLHSAVLNIIYGGMFALGDKEQTRTKSLQIIKDLIEAGADVNMESTGTWKIFKRRVADDPELLEILRQAGWRGPMNQPAAPEVATAPPTPPRAKQTKAAPASGLLGARDFVQFMFDGQPEWSLIAVEAPVAAVVEAYVRFRGARDWTQNVPVVRLTAKSGPLADEIPAVQLKDSPWTIMFRSLFDLTGVEIDQVPKEAEFLSAELKTRAITFMAEDTSGAMGYDLFQNGALVEKAEWGSGFDRFESQLRSKPDWPEDDFDIADLVFRELGVYIPICYAEADAKRPRLVAHKDVWKHVARADLINL